KPIVIAIDNNNIIYFNDKPIDIQSLKTELSSIDNKTLIQLKSDKDSKFESFIQIVDILKEKGHENFGISTKNK
ncbi:biopolymer transporter ExbD, partial [uncultured Helicobacter sp.]